MFYVDKTVTENPFVDNVIYYAKLMALNCSVKDSEEALANETVESMKAGNTYIACVEGRATYEMFDSFPVGILQNYIPQGSNLDIYSKSPRWLQVRLESFEQPMRSKILDRLSSLARTVYIDHYDVMTKYIEDVGPAWLTNHEALYNKCKDGSATYMDLFDELPMRTSLRIIRSYLNSHGYMDLAALWDPDSEITKLDLARLEAEIKMSGESSTQDEEIKRLLLDTDYVASVTGYSPTQSNYMNQFIAYVDMRTDDAILTELNRISNAMREVFISHYEIMEDRNYFSRDAEQPVVTITNEDGYTYSMPVWMGYQFDEDTYKKCKDAIVPWTTLYPYFPGYEIKEALDKVFGASTVAAYNLDESPEVLQSYLENYSTNPDNETAMLNRVMTEMYLANYQFYLNKNVYYECVYGSRTIYDLYDYLPTETLKSIIDTEFPETNSLQILSANKNMLNSYLGTLPAATAKQIKDNIAKDMIKWYPSHHVETNNYYRAYLGLPPIDEKGNVYVDTLQRTYNEDSKSYTEFGDKFVNICPTDIYPAAHWKSELYTYDNYDIGLLKDAGVIDTYVEEGCKSSINSNRYKYLRFLGDEKLDLYTMRKAENFELMGMPSIDDTEIRNKFVDAYVINRDYVIRCVYADAYKFQSDYYNKFIILFIIMNTVIDCVTSIPNYIINRDVFDARCVQYMFEAFGIPYYPEIPLKYQKAMLKNLNILIKYKSSTRNMIDICKLFGYSDIRIFGYYMMKSRNKTADGNYIPEENNDIDYDLDKVYVKYDAGTVTDISGRRFCKLSEYPNFNEDYFMKEISVMNDDGTIGTKKIINNDRDVYVYDANLEQMIPLKDSTYFTKIKASTEPSDIKFIKVPIGEAITEYKSNDENIASYDDVTDEETWAGGLDKDYLKQKIMDYAFNVVKSKYISIDAMTNLTEISFQTSYFFNMLFDNAYGENALVLDLPSLKSGHKFRLTDVVFFMFALTYYYSGLKDKIMYSPTQILYVKGYNFQDVINDIMNDERYFSQTDEEGKPLPASKKEDVFNINTEIAKRSYNYRETFNSAKLKVKGFNLNADIDALEKWLNDEWQMSLDDFVVSDNDEDGILTIRHFYSLNNSYYQKDIFNGDMSPMAYNNVIKYAYNYDTVAKVQFKDLEYIPHFYLPETMVVSNIEENYGMVYDIVAAVSKNTKSKTYDELMERIKTVHNYEELSNYAYLLKKIFVVSDMDEYENIIGSMSKTYYNLILEQNDVNTIYVLNPTVYGHRGSGDDAISVPVYNKYDKDENGDYIPDGAQYFYYNKNTDTYSALISGLIYVKDTNGIFTFGTDKIYERTRNGEYVEIDYSTHTTYDPTTNAMILNLGDYYIKSGEEWILNPDNCYIKIKIDGVWQYVLLKDLENYTGIYIGKDDCYIKDEDGHFIKFRYTDYYIRTHNDTEYANEMEYIEEPLYIPVNYETDVYDASLPVDDRVYYKKLEEYLSDDFAISTEMLYVKDSDGNFLSEDSILNPANTWYWDPISDSYRLVIADQFFYLEYETPLNVLYLMVLHGNYDYYKYALEAATGIYRYVPTPGKRYVYNSNTKYVTILNTDATYADTSRLAVVLNQSLVEDVTNESSVGYNPSLNDGVWDENDWYYEGTGNDPDNQFGMHGENKWYYRKPGSDATEGESDAESTVLGSGFYLPSTSYVGSVIFEQGAEYYLSMDVVSNFYGTIQIVSTADDLHETTTGRNYNVEPGITIHIEETFIANSNSAPQIRFVKYNFSTNPIHIGDLIMVSNIKIMKAYSEHYVPADIPNVKALADIYKTNTMIYKWLLTQMNKTDDKKMYSIYKTLYDSLMVSEYNKEIFKMPDGTYALTYTDFLRSRDSTLASILDSLRLMEMDTMQNAISQYIIDICYELSIYLAQLNLEYLYSYFPGMSASFIQQYIFKIINWFKSWKVHLLGISTVYRMGNGVITDENGRVVAEVDGDQFTVKILHDKNVKNRSLIYLKDGFIKDVLKINPLDDISPDGTPYEEKYDFSDSTTCIDETIPLRHRLRMIVRGGNRLEYYDSKNDLHLVLDDDTTKVNVVDENKLAVSTINGDEFKTTDRNRLVISSDANPQDIFASQIIDEINLLSGDYVENREDDEDD